MAQRIMGGHALQSLCRAHHDVMLSVNPSFTYLCVMFSF